MEISYSIFYDLDVIQHDIPKLDNPIKDRIKTVIETRLASKPNIFGKPLRADLHGFWSLRIENYRVIYQINNKNNSVWIRLIEHRSKSYITAIKRFF